MDMAMQMATTATCCAAETPGVTIFELMERNWNGKRCWRSQAPVASSDSSSRVKSKIRQQAAQLTLLQRRVGHLGNRLEARVAREEAQWKGLVTSMQERW